MECGAVLPQRELWLRFAASGDAALRTELVDHYLPLARMLAAWLYRRRGGLPAEFADYLQSAVLGLIEAVDRFDPSRNVPFQFFAARRIRGAVLDALASMSEQHAQVMRRGAVEKRVAALAPSETERGDALQDMVDLALNLSVGFMLQGSGMYRDGEDETDLRAYDDYARRELSQSFARLLPLLPRRQASLLRYHYFFGIELAELARMLDLSPSRLSQLHRQALGNLRTLYRTDGRLDLSG